MTILLSRDSITREVWAHRELFTSVRFHYPVTLKAIKRSFELTSHMSSCNLQTMRGT